MSIEKFMGAQKILTVKNSSLLPLCLKEVLNFDRNKKE